jgi:anti-sigma B factor antagonist
MKIVDAKVEGASLLLTVKVPRLDAATAREFKKECEEIWQPGIVSVTADLAALEFIDSSGVGAFLSLYKKLPPANPSVKFRRVQPSVQTVIELLRLHRIFEIEA